MAHDTFPRKIDAPPDSPSLEEIERTIELYPPELPEDLKDRLGRWIGTRDPFAMGLTVSKAPPVEEIIRAYESESTIELEVTNRTPDMDDDEPAYELGKFKVKIADLRQVQNGEIHFLAEPDTMHGQLPYMGRGEGMMWVWNYVDDSTAGADIAVY